MKKNVNRLGVGVIALALLNQAVWAAGSAGGRLAMPENHENNTARVMSMGSAVVGLPLGSASLLWNPAGLGFLNRMELGAHHSSGLGDSIHEMGVVGMPWGFLGGVAVGLNYVNNGTFEGRDEFGVQTAGYSVTNFGLSAGWGKKVLSNLSVGISARWNSQYLSSISYAAFAADLGLLWTPVDQLTVGAVLANVGTQVAGKFLDSGLRVGASYFVNPDFVMAVSTELKPVGGLDGLRVGAEYWVFPMMAVRGGYVVNFIDYQLDGVTGVTGGLGFKLSEFLLDYAVVPTGELGTSHRFGVTYQMRVEDKPEPAVSKQILIAAPPMITGLNPDRGFESGQTSVMILGSGLTGVTSVLFGEDHAVSFVIHSDTRMTVKSPAHQAGWADVVVTSVAGSSPIVPADRFTFVAEPVPVLPPVVILAKLIVLDDTFFDAEQSNTNKAGEELLKDHIRVLKENPELSICISGYTSASGSEEYNQKLSERRANSVREVLIKGGIDADRLTVVGYGETRPAILEPIPPRVRDLASKSNMRVLFEVGVCKKP